MKFTDLTKEKDNHHYDQLYDIIDAYKKDPEDVFQYIDMWNNAISILNNMEAKHIIDLGCGPGQFGELASRKVSFLLKYTGYDFSKTAIDMASSRMLDKRLIFEERNLKTYNFCKNAPANTIYVTFEFLEHISEDLEVISKIPKNSRIIFSVPSFDYKNHVRFFPSEKSVHERYGKSILISSLRIFNNNPKSPDGKVIYLCSGLKR